MRKDDLLAYFDRLIAAEDSGYMCTKEISEVISELRNELILKNDSGKSCYEENIANLTDGDYNDKFKLTNEIIYTLYQTKVGGEITFPRFSGLTTSIKALEKTYDDVVYIQNNREGTKVESIEDKIVFIEPGVELSRGKRCKCVYKIQQFEVLTPVINSHGIRKYNAIIAK